MKISHVHLRWWDRTSKACIAQRERFLGRGRFRGMREVVRQPYDLYFGGMLILAGWQQSLNEQL